MNDFSRIDLNTLRNDLKEEATVAFLAGGFGAAMIDSVEIERASPAELLKIAEKMGVSLNRYSY